MAFDLVSEHEIAFMTLTSSAADHVVKLQRLLLWKPNSLENVSSGNKPLGLCFMGNATADSIASGVPSPMTMPKAKWAKLEASGQRIEGAHLMANSCSKFLNGVVSCKSPFLPANGPVHSQYACSVAREKWLQALHSGHCHLCCQRCGWTQRKWSRGPLQIRAGLKGSEDWKQPAGMLRLRGNECIDSGLTDMHMHSQQKKLSDCNSKVELHCLNFLRSLQVWQFV